MFLILVREDSPVHPLWANLPDVALLGKPPNGLGESTAQHAVPRKCR